MSEALSCSSCNSKTNVRVFSTVPNISTALDDTPFSLSSPIPICDRCRHEIGRFTPDEVRLAMQVVAFLPMSDAREFVLSSLTFKSGISYEPRRDFTPIEIEGEPVSEMILRERR